MQRQQCNPLRTRLALITTATAAPDPAEALKQLIAVAATATRKSVTSARTG